MNTWFTSDTHFNHTNIIRYCDRPFANVHLMNYIMVGRWNSKVLPEDTVYFLGDFAMGLKEQWKDFLSLLMGHKILILGSHDKSLKWQRENMKWDAIYDEFIWESPKHGKWKLIHKPLYKYDEQILSGHVHQHWHRRGLNINVGVDVNNFEPKTIEELLAVPEDPNRDWVDRRG